MIISTIVIENQKLHEKIKHSRINNEDEKIPIKNGFLAIMVIVSSSKNQFSVLLPDFSKTLSDSVSTLLYQS